MVAHAPGADPLAVFVLDRKLVAVPIPGQPGAVVLLGQLVHHLGEVALVLVSVHGQLHIAGVAVDALKAVLLVVLALLPVAPVAVTVEATDLADLVDAQLQRLFHRDPEVGPLAAEDSVHVMGLSGAVAADPLAVLFHGMLIAVPVPIHPKAGIVLAQMLLDVPAHIVQIVVSAPVPVVLVTLIGVEGLLVGQLHDDVLIVDVAVQPAPLMFLVVLIPERLGVTAVVLKAAEVVHRHAGKQAVRVHQLNVIIVGHAVDAQTGGVITSRIPAADPLVVFVLDGRLVAVPVHIKGNAREVLAEFPLNLVAHLVQVAGEGGFSLVRVEPDGDLLRVAVHPLPFDVPVLVRDVLAHFVAVRGQAADVGHVHPLNGEIVRAEHRHLVVTQRDVAVLFPQMGGQIALHFGLGGRSPVLILPVLFRGLLAVPPDVQVQVVLIVQLPLHLVPGAGHSGGLFGEVPVLVPELDGRGDAVVQVRVTPQARPLPGLFMLLVRALAHDLGLGLEDGEGGHSHGDEGVRVRHVHIVLGVLSLIVIRVVVCVHKELRVNRVTGLKRSLRLLIGAPVHVEVAQIRIGRLNRLPVALVVILVLIEGELPRLRLILVVVALNQGHGEAARPAVQLAVVGVLVVVVIPETAEIDAPGEVRRVNALELQNTDVVGLRHLVILVREHDFGLMHARTPRVVLFLFASPVEVHLVLQRNAVSDELLLDVLAHGLHIAVIGAQAELLLVHGDGQVVLLGPAVHLSVLALVHLAAVTLKAADVAHFSNGDVLLQGGFPQGRVAVLIDQARARVLRLGFLRGGLGLLGFVLLRLVRLRLLRLGFVRLGLLRLGFLCLRLLRLGLLSLGLLLRLGFLRLVSLLLSLSRRGGLRLLRLGLDRSVGTIEGQHLDRQQADDHGAGNQQCQQSFLHVLAPF